MHFRLPTRRGFLATLAALFAAPAAVEAETSSGGLKVLRYAFEIAETALDPAKVQDLYSRTLTCQIFEALYHYDHLARPVKIVPATADGMPEVSADFKVWTVKVKPGIYFADDPAFKGTRRELVAQDYVYSFKRIADPANLSPVWSEVETYDLVGLAALRQAALDSRKPFDYDREIPGLKALDRYTVQFTVASPRPRLVQLLATGDLYGAVARDVVEFYGDALPAHPVGTGPFKLAQWRRSSFIAFDRNPDYREVLYDAQPAADDVEGQALLARFKGRRLPMVDRVEVSIIEQDQPRYLAFITGEADLQYRLGYEFIGQTMPNGKIAPNLAKQGVRGYQEVEAASSYSIFNMEDPLWGGYTPEKVALRRAIALGMDSATEIAYAYNGQGTISQTPLLPHTIGFDPNYRSVMGEYDPARAKALLDLYGYKAGPDGWRSAPDGTPLVFKASTQSDTRSRRITEVLDRNMRAIGIRVEPRIAQWPENLKAARAGKLASWTLGGSADAPDALGALASYDSRQIGGQNFARFRLPAFDALYDRLQAMPDGPERNALFREAENLAAAYMPYKFKLDRISTDLTHRWVLGYRRSIFWNDWWQYIDIDNSLRPPP